MGKALVLALTLSGGFGQAHADTLPVRRSLLTQLQFALGTIGSLMATPSSVNFPATNPNLGVISASSPTSVNWIVQDVSLGQAWTLSVQAGAGAFSGCSTVPISAVRVSCASANVSGGFGTGACRGPFTLSTTPQQVAGGSQGLGINSYSVTINYTLDESWRYIPNLSCSLSLTYTVNAP